MHGKSDSKLALWHILVAYVALALGGVAGLLQGLVRGGLIELPYGIGYYQLLTAHGVLMALVFTTFFIIGFLYAGMVRTTGPLLNTVNRIAWIGFLMMVVGTVLGVILVLLNKATVLYTFYAPMKASPWFYIALVLIVVGSWCALAAIVSQLRYWKRTNKGKMSPLFAFMSATTMILWFVATLGVAATVLLQFIPWSFGWVDKINVMISRTLFWYFGHPLVYFWLLPAYMCWYVILPKIIGGKMFSESMARLAFVLFLIFSVPVGFHHQLMEPGISPTWKYVQVVLTFLVVVPSLMTAFSMFATFELYGRSKGAKGLFGWLKKLPYGDARFLLPFVGMLLFIPAGAGGIINASNQMNAVVHNTLWVTGHFHITVATTVAMTFFGVTFWLIPHLTGRTFTKKLNRMGILLTIVWSLGMVIMSGAMHIVGLFGAPRRTAYTTYFDHPTALSWLNYETVMAIGGVILFIGIIILVASIVMLLRAPKGTEEFPIAEVHENAGSVPAVLDKWGIWIVILVVLILIAYTVPFSDMLGSGYGSKPWVTW
jgi:cytochrome c oxidase subunit 1